MPFMNLKQHKPRKLRCWQWRNVNGIERLERTKIKLARNLRIAYKS